MAYTSALMKINLIALKYNLDQFYRYLKPDTKLMLMVKANAYGTGFVPIAQLAEKTGLVEYLAVAYVSEGVSLRLASHISLPIMIMVVADSEFDTCREFSLEPVIHSMHLLDKLIEFLNRTEGNATIIFQSTLSNYVLLRSKQFTTISTCSLKTGYWFASSRH